MSSSDSLSFVKEKITTLLGHTEVRYTASRIESQQDGATPFRLVAGAIGVSFQGSGLFLTDVPELEIFAKAVSDAWADHLKLKPKLATTLAGH